MKKITVTIPGATEASGLSRSTIYRAFDEGKLTPLKAGKRTLILVAELEEYLRSLPKGGSGK